MDVPHLYENLLEGNWILFGTCRSVHSTDFYGYSIIVNSPRPIQNLAFSWGGTSRESRPNMRLLAVEQLRKIENDVNIASFSLCLH